ncbi:hypothetical protein C8F01DRAFT_1144976 [Mycena amicta]|nr:hypothetical protein C8F01DRAFT_1144976 [Mycena amicta]
MSAPFVYVPEASNLDSNSPWPHPYYPTPKTVHTPFLPPSPLVYPSSPGPSPYSPNPGTPGTKPARLEESAYAAAWSPLARPRQRTSSWAAPPTQGSGSPPTTSKFLHPGDLFKPGHKKSKSSGNVKNLIPALAAAANGATPPPWVHGAPPHVLASGKPLTHPWIDADFHASPAFAAVPIFRFDLAPTTFAPECLTSGPGAPAVWTNLQKPEHANEAFFPPRFELRIVHPELVWWPVVLKLTQSTKNKEAKSSKEAETAAQPPITLGDVLSALHHALHRLITPDDWASIPPAQQQAVSAAFTARCRAEALRSGVSPAHLHDREQEERAKGVKRVDFLGGKTWFRGLMPVKGEVNGGSGSGSVVMLVTS